MPKLKDILLVIKNYIEPEKKFIANSIDLNRSNKEQLNRKSCLIIEMGKKRDGLA